jgi:dihydrofolate synthase/folylpolyglutamate synthase
MTYQETCQYLFNQMPMFEKQGSAGYKEGLTNTVLLDEHLGHPHQSYATIHIAGTNGKGSCSHTLAAILQQCGYKVGLYTSPHLIDFRERIRINGEPISERYVVDFVERERSFFEPLHPSFFEVTTAMAFQYFKDKEVDIAVIEVGLGGRLDCTNIITPILSIITNISFDHTQFLGDTLAKIAAEKAGIIKRGIPIIIGEANDETRPVFLAKAQELNAPIEFAEDYNEVISAECIPGGGMLYHTRNNGDLHGDLSGSYQEKNMNTSLAAVNQLVRSGYLCECQKPHNLEKSRKEMLYAINHVAEMTGLMGRWQVMQQNPKVVCDTGHNVGGWQYLSKQLEQQQCHQMHIIFGMVSDKDVNSVLELLPKNAIFYFTKADNHRAINETDLQHLAAQHGLKGESYPSVHEAYTQCMKNALRDDFIFVGGSSYVVGDFLKIFN